MRRSVLIVAIIALQVICAAVLLARIFGSVLGLRLAPIDWRLYELVEVGAALGLVLGVVTGALAIRKAQAGRARAEEALRVAAGAFQEVLDERFDEWGLTPAEREVALFSFKGFAPAEIARLRETSEGTVKAQSAAVYRKAGVRNRAQLLALFVAELLETDPA